MKIIIIPLISAIISIIFTLLVNKIFKKKTEKLEIMKSALSGVTIGFINYVIFNSLDGNFTKILSDFDTGSPNL